MSIVTLRCCVACVGAVAILRNGGGEGRGVKRSDCSEENRMTLGELCRHAIVNRKIRQLERPTISAKVTRVSSKITSNHVI